MLMIVLFLTIVVHSKGRWSYDNAKTWPINHPYCGGNLQSPIDLQFNISQIDHRLKQIRVKELYSREPLELVNYGFTVQLNLKDHYVLKNVAPENEDYNVEQLHFHWGHPQDCFNGSEHLLEGLPFPLEMHAVAYSNIFSNINEAMTNTRGLAVVGVFFKLSNEPNLYLEPIITALEHIKHKGKTVSLTGNFDLKKLFHEKSLSRYYRYDGSLTTPPCYESVLWNVLLEPLELSPKQLHAFQNLFGDKSEIMKDTYRTIQPLGSRKLFRSFYSRDIYLDEMQRKHLSTSTGYGQYSSINMKFSFILISLFIIIL